MTQSTVDQRADYLLGLTRKLADLVAEEARRLEAGVFRAQGPEWEEKERLVHAYRIEMTQLKANPAQLKGLAPGVRDALATAAKALEQGLASHAAALAAKREVTDGLVRAIAADAAAQRSAPSGYDRAGASAPPKSNPGAAGLTLNARA
ncbi:flagellar basal-body protein FlbY [bacterium]|nr:flagellar basal-body protein FlbY [bacterium]